MNKETQQLITQIEKKKLLNSLFFPVLFVLFLWAIKGTEILFDVSFARFGIFPKTIEGVPGIILSPLIHGSIEHLYNNSIPLLVLGSAIFFFYKEVVYKVIFYSWLFTGIWVWSMGRESFHIGASGLIYAWATFVFLSGILRKNKSLIAISMLVIFLYGNLVWWVFPIEEEISWEGHLMGSIAGLVLAIYFKKKGPRNKLPDWMYEDDEDEDENAGESTHDQDEKDIKINYVYKSNKDHK